jgi:glyoxylase I family protein
MRPKLYGPSSRGSGQDHESLAKIGESRVHSCRSLPQLIESASQSRHHKCIYTKTMLIDRRTVIIGAATLAAVGTAESATPDTVEVQMNMPTERVLGIGGLFFRSHDPKKLAQWYQLNLGIDPRVWQQAAGPTAFTPFAMDTDYFGSKQQAWMVNYRVRSLDAMVAQLQKSNIEVKVDPEKSPYGRFARLHDPEGNPIELWEPASPA